jgi:hypothetical protein
MTHQNPQCCEPGPRSATAYGFPKTDSPERPLELANGTLLAQRATNIGINGNFVRDTTHARGLTGERMIVEYPRLSGPCHWVATVTAWSIPSNVADPTPSEDAIVAARQRHSVMQVRLDYSDGTPLEQKIPLDIGPGWQLSFFGAAPRIFLLLDDITAVYQTPGGSSPLSGLGEATLQSSAIVGTLAPTPESRASQRPLWQLTDGFQVDANTARVLPVPPRVQYVRVYQNSGTPLTTAFDFQTPQGQTVGALDFVAGQRFTERTRIPGGASQISTGPTIANDRIFSVVWEIEL